MILVYFSLGVCVNDAFNNRTNHPFTLVIVVHFINNAIVCWIIRSTLFNVNVCLNNLWRYEHNQFE